MSVAHWNGSTLPYRPQHLSLADAAHESGSTGALAVSFSRKSFTATTFTALILRYGP